MVALVLTTQVFDCQVDAGAHDERTLRKIELVQLRQQVLILGVLLIPVFDQLDDSFDFRRGRLELAVEHGECGFRRLVFDLQRFLRVHLRIQDMVGGEGQDLHNIVFNHLYGLQQALLVLDVVGRRFFEVWLQGRRSIRNLFVGSCELLT